MPCCPCPTVRSLSPGDDREPDEGILQQASSSWGGRNGSAYGGWPELCPSWGDQVCCWGSEFGLETELVMSRQREGFRRALLGVSDFAEGRIV